MAASRVGWSSGSVGEVWLLATKREFKRFADFVEIVAAIAGVKAMLHRPNEVVHVQRHRDGHPTLSKPEQHSEVSYDCTRKVCLYVEATKDRCLYG